MGLHPGMAAGAAGGPWGMVASVVLPELMKGLMGGNDGPPQIAQGTMSSNNRPYTSTFHALSGTGFKPEDTGLNKEDEDWWKQMKGGGAFTGGNYIG